MNSRFARISSKVFNAFDRQICSMKGGVVEDRLIKWEGHLETTLWFSFEDPDALFIIGTNGRIGAIVTYREVGKEEFYEIEKQIEKRACPLVYTFQEENAISVSLSELNNKMQSLSTSNPTFIEPKDNDVIRFNSGHVRFDVKKQDYKLPRFLSSFNKAEDHKLSNLSLRIDYFVRVTKFHAAVMGNYSRMDIFQYKNQNELSVYRVRAVSNGVFHFKDDDGYDYYLHTTVDTITVEDFGV